MDAVASPQSSEHRAQAPGSKKCRSFDFALRSGGGTPQKVSDEAWWATWSADGNYLSYRRYPQNAAWQIVDVRTGEKSAIPSSQGMGGYWITQDTLVGANQKGTSFQAFNLKTQKWADLGPKSVGHRRGLDQRALSQRLGKSAHSSGIQRLRA